MSELSFPTRTPTTRRPSGTPTPAAASLFMGGWLVLMWVLEVFDQMTFNSLDQFGVSPRDVSELPQIFTAPFLHFGYGHLISNSVPFFVLGLLVLLSGVRPFVAATLFSVVASGLAAWLLSAPMTVTAGASGLVFGWLAYLLVRAFFTRAWVHAVVAVVVFLFYGAILIGVLPGEPGISWQGHLGGAVGGLVAAWVLHSRRPAGNRR